MKSKSKRIIFITLISLIVIIIVSSFFKPVSNNEYVFSDVTDVYNKITRNSIVDNISYTNKIVEWRDKGINDVNNYNETFLVENVVIDNLNPAKFIGVDDSVNGEVVTLYYSKIVSNASDKVVEMTDGGEIKFTPNINFEGLYQISFDYYDLEDSILPNEISVKVNDEFQYEDSQIILINSNWTLSSKEFSLDRYQNEIQSNSIKVKEWIKLSVEDTTRFHKSFKFHLKPGDIVSLVDLTGNFLVGNIYLSSINEVIDYQDYISQFSNLNIKQTDLIELNSEAMDLRNNPSIRLKSERDPSASSYHSQFQRLNAIDGISWKNGGESVSWSFDVKETGLYNVSFKYLQSELKNMPVFREIKIDDEVPFSELATYAFPYTNKWINRTLVDEKEEAFLIYLSEGNHSITLTSVIYPYRNAIEAMQSAMTKINQLSLDVKKNTSNSSDAYRDWDIEYYVPHAKGTLLEVSDMLRKIYSDTVVLSGISNPAELSNLLSASDILNTLAKDINSLPKRLIQLSDGDSSSAQLIGDLIQRLMKTNLDLQKIMIHTDEKLPKPHSNIFVRIIEGVKRLVLSFVNNPYKATKTKEGELVVWVSHPRQYIEIMQTLVDSNYDGPLRVTLSQMPDENKLVLANATGRSPDIAIGVNHWIPHDFAIRNAALDLRQFPGYADLVSKFSKGVMIPYAFEEGMYGLPETQNFWVTYYRKDILENIGINKVPETWDEIIEILPQLQRYGMNYYSPISGFEGFKPFVTTMPFIYQFGDSLFTEDGMATNINSEDTIKGVELMTELFTLYNLQKRVPNFYNHFRYGTLPIGISDLATYILLRTASSELQGQWGIALHPGVKKVNENGDSEIVRFSPAGGQSSMILSSTKYPDEAWDFLKWWMSTETQIDFAYNLQTTYGEMYLWNTANLEAFAELPIPKKDKDIILEQWEYAIEASRIPGAYMIEREISNAWNKIVFNDVNPRQALDEAVRISNRELLYKMEEFGYSKNGVKLKNFKVPTIYNIDEWLTEVIKND